MTPAPLRRLLAIPPAAATFAELGFAPCDAAVRARLERVLATFLRGYNLALAMDDPRELAAALRRENDTHHVGFAFEGAGMTYALLDLMFPWRASRLRAFIEGPGEAHDYIACVGAGFAVARVPWGRRLWPSYSRRLDPLIAWCLADGYGFHQGIFHPRRFVAGRGEAPAGLPLYARRLFDAGLGRSLWWSQGASPRRIAKAIEEFAPERRPEMWCGIGTAAAYAGGASELDDPGGIGDRVLRELGELAGPCRLDLLSGVPFAARMRERGGNPSPVTDRAAEVLLGISAGAASRWVVDALERVLAEDGPKREARARESYLLVRARLIEDLRHSAQGDPLCTVPRERTTASS